MDILTLSVRLQSPPRQTLFKPAATPKTTDPATGSAQPPAVKEPSAAIKRMLEQAEQGKAAMEAAKAKEKEAAKEKRKIIKQRLDQIVEKLRIIKELHANDPKRMASQLAQVFRELKTALKDYRNAGGTLTQMIGDSNGQGQVDTSEKPLTKEEAREWVEAANEAKAFMGHVGAIAKKVKELLEESRLKAKMMAPENEKEAKDRDEAFEEADKMFKELGEFMEDMGKDLKDALEGMQVEGDKTLSGAEMTGTEPVMADLDSGPAQWIDIKA